MEDWTLVELWLRIIVNIYIILAVCQELFQSLYNHSFQPHNSISLYELKTTTTKNNKITEAQRSKV